MATLTQINLEKTPPNHGKLRPSNIAPYIVPPEQLLNVRFLACASYRRSRIAEYNCCSDPMSFLAAVRPKEPLSNNNEEFLIFNNVLRIHFFDIKSKPKDKRSLEDNKDFLFDLVLEKEEQKLYYNVNQTENTPYLINSELKSITPAAAAATQQKEISKPKTLSCLVYHQLERKIPDNTSNDRLWKMTVFYYDNPLSISLIKSKKTIRISTPQPIYPVTNSCVGQCNDNIYYIESHDGLAPSGNLETGHLLCFNKITENAINISRAHKFNSLYQHHSRAFGVTHTVSNDFFTVAVIKTVNNQRTGHYIVRFTPEQKTILEDADHCFRTFDDIEIIDIMPFQEDGVFFVYYCLYTAFNSKDVPYNNIPHTKHLVYIDWNDDGYTPNILYSDRNFIYTVTSRFLCVCVNDVLTFRNIEHPNKRTMTSVPDSWKKMTITNYEHVKSGFDSEREASILGVTCGVVGDMYPISGSKNYIIVIIHGYDQIAYAFALNLNTQQVFYITSSFSLNRDNLRAIKTVEGSSVNLTVVVVDKITKIAFIKTMYLTDRKQSYMSK